MISEDHVTLKTGVNSAAHHRNKLAYILEYCKIGIGSLKL